MSGGGAGYESLGDRGGRERGSMSEFKRVNMRETGKFDQNLTKRG